MARTTIELKKLNVPLPLAMGRYELLTKEELRDHFCDITAEYNRRLAKTVDE